jgi:hypothetical protein
MCVNNLRNLRKQIQNTWRETKRTNSTWLVSQEDKNTKWRYSLAICRFNFSVCILNLVYFKKNLRSGIMGSYELWYHLIFSRPCTYSRVGNAMRIESDFWPRLSEPPTIPSRQHKQRERERCEQQQAAEPSSSTSSARAGHGGLLLLPAPQPRPSPTLLTRGASTNVVPPEVGYSLSVLHARRVFGQIPAAGVARFSLQGDIGIRSHAPLCRTFPSPRLPLTVGWLLLFLVCQRHMNNPTQTKRCLLTYSC